MSDRPQSLRSPEAEERVWLKQAQRDPAAFKPIFEKYYDRIFNYLLRRTCDAMLAQDLAMNTFLKALDHVDGFAWQGIPLSSWLFRIATNELHQNHRRTRRQVPLSESLCESLRDDRATDARLLELEEQLRQDSRYRRACIALSQLEPKYQAVLTLRYFENKSLKEIAEILELPENTVKTHIRRGLIQIRDRLT